MSRAALARARVSVRQRARVCRVWGPSAIQCINCYTVRQLGNELVPKSTKMLGEWNVKNAYQLPTKSSLVARRAVVHTLTPAHARAGVCACVRRRSSRTGSAVCDCVDVDTGAATLLAGSSHREPDFIYLLLQISPGLLQLRHTASLSSTCGTRAQAAAE